jgi:hypothetical protein
MPAVKASARSKQLVATATSEAERARIHHCQAETSPSLWADSTAWASGARPSALRLSTTSSA